MSKKLYVGNISFKAMEEDIKELFSTAGTVESVNLIKDSHTGQLKGFGFVEMATEEDAKNAIESINGKTLMDRALSVAEARPQEPRERRSFGGEKRGFGGERKGGFGGRKGGFGGGKGRR